MVMWPVCCRECSAHRSQELMALNGGPHFKFTEAISLSLSCETQEEVDRFRRRAFPTRGWLKDKFGVSWQIVPTVLGELLGDSDPAKAKRVMKAMLQMAKIDISRLWQAHDEA